MHVPDEARLIFESFARNARVHRAVFETLTMSDLERGDDAGGWNVGQHFADMVQFRRAWLTRVAPAYAERAPNAIDEGSPTWLRVQSIDELRDAFEGGDAAMRAAVLDAMNDGRGFERVYESHPAHLIQHCIVHDAHHRGQIMALLRRAGRSFEVRERLESETWAFWRE